MCGRHRKNDHFQAEDIKVLIKAATPGQASFNTIPLLTVSPSPSTSSMQPIDE